MPTLAVVVPTLNEARTLPGLLCDLHPLRVDHEVIVADGGSTDGTADVARPGGARVVTAPPGRGAQLNAGARASSAPWLCFLHADVRVSADARNDLERAIRSAGVTAAVWRLRIDAAGTVFRVIERSARLRDRLLGLPYGDQGLLVRREAFDDAGGYPDIPIMEDVALVRRLRRRHRLYRFSSSLQVSARRWEREGPVRTSVRNALLISAYAAGVAPGRLARWYRAEPP